MAEQEQDTRRFFFGPDDDVKYFIDTPTAEHIREADWEYSKTFTRCLEEGITTSAEMVDILTRRDIIGPTFEQRANELSDNLALKIAELEDANDINTKRELSLEVARAREELFQWNQRLNGPMNNTAEQISDDARLEYLTSAMVVDEAGNPVWENYDNYLREKSQSLALRARFEVMLFLQGLDSNFLEQTPEAVALREVEADALQKAEAALKAAEAIEEEKLNKDKASVPKKKKKTTRKIKKKDTSEDKEE